jgi:ATP-dependent exoDNAse (exonuclease V) beta subunit
MTEVVDQAQRERALDPLRSFCVVSPAGSGKTELLIQRTLTLLARVETPEEVLAITFTRKAAAEMRERIHTALQAAAGPEPGDAHRAKTWQLARAVIAASEARGWHLLETPGRLNIRTIDGFSAALNRDLPVLSRFGGQLAPLDDAKPLYEQAVRELLQQLETDPGVSDDLGALLRHFDNNWQQLQALLERMLARRDEWLRHLGTGLGESGVAGAVLEASYQRIAGALLSQLEEELGDVAGELCELVNFARENLGQPHWDTFPAADVSAIADWQELAGLLLTGSGSWRVRLDKRQGFPATSASREYKARFSELVTALECREGLAGHLAGLQSLPRRTGAGKDWPLLLSLTRLLPRLAAQLELVFQERGQVDYAQLGISARRALGPDAEPTELALKLDYRLRHILVDEFQDTAANQYELVRLLTRGWAEANELDPANPNTLFIVGDGMQSIYGFRDADVSLFIRASREGFNGVELETLTLSSNFRSQARLVDWCNQTFQAVFPGHSDEQLGQVAFTRAAAERVPTVETPVTLAGFSGDAARRLEARYVVDRVAEGISDPDCESIAVLVRNRSHLVDIIGEMRARDIPWQAQDIDSLVASPVVADLLTLCRALYSRADRLAWMALLRAPWCGLRLADLLVVARGPGRDVSGQLLDEGVRGELSDDGRRRSDRVAAVMARSRDRLPEHGLRRTLEAAWLELQGPCATDEKLLADARDFFRLLEILESNGDPLDPGTLEKRVERLFAADGGPQPVQLMTLHKAKGLEFDWVIMPGLGRVPRADSRELLLWEEFNASAGSEGFLLALDDRRRPDDYSLYQFLDTRRKRRRALEATRLFYVGATRAIQRLWLTSEVSLDQDSGEPRPPSAASLLHCIWDACSGQLELPVVAEPGERPGAVDGRRLARLQWLSEPSQADDRVSRSPGNLPRPPTGRLQRCLGTVVHSCLERLSGFDGERLRSFDIDSWAPWWQAQLVALGIGGEQLTAAVSEVGRSLRRVLDDERGLWLLSSERAGAASELSLSSLGEGGDVQEHVIDRTFVEDDERWVVDYKSSVPETSEALEAFLARERERYLPQLRRYAEVVAGIDGRKIRTALYFTAIPHWLEIDHVEEATCTTP